MCCDVFLLVVANIKTVTFGNLIMILITKLSFNNSSLDSLYSRSSEDNFRSIQKSLYVSPGLIERLHSPMHSSTVNQVMNTDKSYKPSDKVS